MRRSIIATAVLAAAALALPAQAAAPTVDLQPEELPRGADIGVPHLEDGEWGDVFVDGARRVELPGRIARIVGQAGDDWLVTTQNGDYKRNRRVVRVREDGSVRDLYTNIDTSSVILSADGSTLAWQRYVDRGRKVVTYAASARTGSVLRTKGPNRQFQLLDVDAKRVVVGGGGRVLQWRIGSGRSRTIVKKYAGTASIEHDLLSYYTKDPYDGGCTRLVRLSKPRVKVWTSCVDRVASISPDGRRMLTFHKLTDGLGPGLIHERAIDGTLLASWSTGWFGSWGWESPTAVLLQVNGDERSSTVRCVEAACENATDPGPVMDPRPVASNRGR